MRELELEGASSSTVAEERAADGARAAGLRFWKTAGRGAREPVGVLPEAGRPRPRVGGRGGGGRLRRYVCEGPLPARLALHALGRYREALPELGKARDLEPKNAQVADAIRFAEMRLTRGA